VVRFEVRLLGGLAARAGAGTVDVELDEAPTVGRLREAVGEQHPALAPLLSAVKVAVDLEIAPDSRRVEPASELALLPPVAGGAGEARPAASTRDTARILADGRRVLTGLRTSPLDAAAAVAAITGPEVGGTVTFLGSVRDHAPGLSSRVERLDYSAYPRMAERVLEVIADEVLDQRPEVAGIALLHAVGELEVGDPTVLVVCAAAHRGPAFAACEHALERLKAEVPVFKREVTEDGQQRWVGLDGR
jgi:MoaE-MoaD fusion protein